MLYYFGVEFRGINNERRRFYMIYGILGNRANFKENPSTGKQLQKFCKHKQASTRLNFASKSSKGQILQAVENLCDHSIPLHKNPSI